MGLSDFRIKMRSVVRFSCRIPGQVKVSKELEVKKGLTSSVYDICGDIFGCDFWRDCNFRNHMLNIRNK